MTTQNSTAEAPAPPVATDQAPAASVSSSAAPAAPAADVAPAPAPPAANEQGPESASAPPAPAVDVAPVQPKESQPQTQPEPSVVAPKDESKDEPKEATLQPTTTSTQAPSSASSSGSRTQKQSLEIDTSHPEDFDGEISTTSELPSPELLKKIDNYVVLDRNGRTHTFKSLHSGRNVARRMLIIFVRHFYCGNCQDYLRSLSESITTDSLLGLPVNTFITVIGCGDPALIQMYADATNCPFPIYTDPTRSLFKRLGMTRTWDMGEKPAYIKKSFFSMTSGGVMQGLKKLSSGLATKGGDFKQVGGEFLFEPSDLVTPISTPDVAEPDRSLGLAAEQQQRKSGSEHEEPEDLYGSEEKRVTWCHRMRTTRDHAEVPELMEVLGLDGNGKPIDDEKRWTTALKKRKGTGLSMASQMSQLTMASKSSQRRSEVPAA